ncbi:hypothetical protein Tco_0427923 [Tanacetum coccineum]
MGGVGPIGGGVARCVVGWVVGALGSGGWGTVLGRGDVGLRDALLGVLRRGVCEWGVVAMGVVIGVGEESGGYGQLTRGVMRGCGLAVWGRGSGGGGCVVGGKEVVRGERWWYCVGVVYGVCGAGGGRARVGQAGYRSVVSGAWWWEGQ